MNSRRKFLKQTLDGVLLLGVARLVPQSALHGEELPPVPKDLQYFDPHEYRVVRAIAGRMVGPASGGAPDEGEIDVAGRADVFLSTADPEIRDQIHQLLTVFNAPFFTFLFDFRFSSFLNMSPQDKDSYLEDWMKSILALRRTGFQALKRLCMSMYYTDSRSWKEIGYEGMFLPEERP